MAGGSVGIDVHLDRVPLREADMEPVEVMISESQERMVCVTDEPDAVAEVCARWELHCADIGVVTASGALRMFWDDEVVGEIPAELLTEETPRYRVATSPRTLQAPIAHRPIKPEPAELVDLLRTPNLKSRAWVYRRYDHLVGSRTVRRPGLDAAVLRLRPSHRGLAVSLDGSGRVACLDPQTGGMLAVVEAARNVACAGGKPLAVTDCLNFGNPEKPEIAWELTEVIEGMSLACEALGIPVVSGNVSLYNETDGFPIYPTPVVGCVGLVPDVRLVPAGWREGDAIYVVGAPELTLDGSEYQSRFLGGAAGRPPRPQLGAEAALVRFLWRAAPTLTAAHDCAEGGLAVALAELALWSRLGAEVELEEDAVVWFGEGGGQAVAALRPENESALEGMPYRRIGEAGGTKLLGVELDDLVRAGDCV
jgi:phosphoribosylformylglycinamidine synthase